MTQKGQSDAKIVGDWWLNWFPLIFPLMILVLRIAIVIRFGEEYRIVRFPSDLCFYGGSFYVWALSAREADVQVCPRQMGDGEFHYIIFFLVANFFLSVILFPEQTNVSFWWISGAVAIAAICAVGSPVYLRWKG